MNLAAIAVGRGDVEQARGLLRRLLAADEAQRALTGDERQRVEAWLAQ